LVIKIYKCRKYKKTIENPKLPILRAQNGLSSNDFFKKIILLLKEDANAFNFIMTQRGKFKYRFLIFTFIN